jgi:hypothetical protein
MKIKTNILFLISFCLLLISGLLIIFALYQIRVKTDLIKDQYVRDLEVSKIGSLSSLKKENIKLSEQENVLKEVFLSQEELIPFISNLESQSEKIGLKIEITKVEKGTEEQLGELYKIQPISFYISLDGEIEKIHQFIKQNLNQEKNLQLQDFKVYKTGVDTSGYNARIILTGNLLYI